MPYHDAFYKDIIAKEGANVYASWKGSVVGAVCSQVQDLADGQRQLYILTLAVLAPFRGRGIGTQLIESVLEYCKQHRISKVALHVQTSNTDAIQFYTSKFKFIQGELVENYYRRIDPPHCYLLYKNLDE